MQNISIGDNLHEMLNPVSGKNIEIICNIEITCMKCQMLYSGKNKKKISICHLQNLPRDL